MKDPTQKISEKRASSNRKRWIPTKRRNNQKPSQKRLKSSLKGLNNKRRRRMKILKNFLYQPTWPRVLPLSSLTCSELNNETQSGLSRREKLTARSPQSRNAFVCDKKC